MATCKQENQFLPSQGEGEGPGKDGVPPSPPPPPQEWGKEPDALEYSVFEEGIHIGDGIAVVLRLLLGVSVKDARGRPVRAPIEWLTIDRHVADLSRDGVLEAKTKGNCEVWFRVKHTTIESVRIPVRVWNVDHVLLTPRTLEIPLRTRQQIVAEGREIAAHS